MYNIWINYSGIPIPFPFAKDLENLFGLRFSHLPSQFPLPIDGAKSRHSTALINHRSKDLNLFLEPANRLLERVSRFARNKEFREQSKSPMHILSSPDCSRLAPLVLDHTRTARTKPNRELFAGYLHS